MPIRACLLSVVLASVAHQCALAESCHGQQVDLTDPALNTTSLGYPGYSVGGLSGQKPVEAPLLPIRLHLEDARQISERVVVFTVKITNLGPSIVLIPESLDQVKTHSHGTGRIIGTFRLIGDSKTAQDQDGTTETATIPVFGSQTQPGSLAALPPGSTLCVKLNGYFERSLRGGVPIPVAVSYQQINLRDGAFQIQSLFRPVLSDNSIVLK